MKISAFARNVRKQGGTLIIADAQYVINLSMRVMQVPASALNVKV